ncbi:MAG: hypothetical protein R3E54_08365 [Halioglobus sp.]
MSSNYNISYSFSIGGTQSEEPPPAAPLYAFGDCRECNLGNGAVLLVNRARSAQAVVSRDVAIALDHCREFRSLQAHAEYLTAYMPELGGDVAAVRSVLEHVRDSGLLEAAADYAGLLTTGGATHQAADVTRTAPPSRVFIITCDRPQAVARLLESMLANAELGRHEALCLVDDSRDSANAERNRELVADFNLKSARDMRYFGLTERAAFIAALSEQLPQHIPALRFLLDRAHWEGHKTYGMSRTLCLLLSVGRRALVMDDDVLCKAFASPFCKPGLVFCESLCEADFYPDPRSWLARLRALPEDPLRAHLQCLGHGMAGALEALDFPSLAGEDLASSQEKILRGLNAASPVLVTQNGTLGDPGTGDTSWAYSLTGESLARLLGEPGSIAEKLTARQFWMGWSQPVFARRANMSQVTGLDNSALLPPYFPAWRGEDQLFGGMLRYLHPDALVLNYPFAVPHLPLEARQGATAGNPAVPSGLALIDAYLAQQATDVPGFTLADRLASLVQLMRGAARSGDAQLAALYRELLATAQTDTLRQLGDALRGPGNHHSEWRGMLEARQRSYFAAIGRQTVPVQLFGVAEGTPEEHIWTQFRQLAGEFANALEAWPALRDAAAEADPLAARATTP